MNRKIIGKFKDETIGADYELELFSNAHELSKYLKENLASKKIDYKDFSYSHAGEKENPPKEIYEYQNFVLMEKKNKEFILLDGFRRLLLYNTPETKIFVRVYKESDLTSKQILTLLIYLNHFKFYSNVGAYFDRGFSLLLHTAFGLNVKKIKSAFNAYLTSDQIENKYWNDGKTGEDENSCVKQRIVNPHFISDMFFLEKLLDEGLMVDKFMGVLVQNERQKSEEEFSSEKFIDFARKNEVLKNLIDRHKKVGTNNSADSQKVVNQTIEIYKNIFILMRGGKAEKSYAETMVELKALSKTIQKDKNWIKLTGSQSYRKIEDVVLNRLKKGEEVKFKFIIYPESHKVNIKIASGLREEIINESNLKFHKRSLGGEEAVFSFMDGENYFTFRHNYDGYFNTGKKYVRIECFGLLPCSYYDVDLFVNIPKSEIEK